MHLFLLLSLTACTAPGKDDSGALTDDSSADSMDSSLDSDDSGEPVTPQIRFFADVAPMDLSPDGRTALVQRMTTLDGALEFIDTTNGEVSAVTTLGDATRNMATGVSNDQRIAALHGVPVEAGRWSAQAGWEDLASPFSSGCDLDNGGAFDLSDDGTVVVGLVWEGCVPAAFRWSEGGGMLVLDRLGVGWEGGSPTNRASFVSGDGLVVGGFAQNVGLDRSPARWDADGSGELLAPDDLEQTGEVLSIDFDGSHMGVIRGNDGYLWSESGGFVPLGRLESSMPADPVYPNAISYTGDVLFGGVGSEFFTVPSAFVWTEEAGMRALQELAVAAGVEIAEGYWLSSVVAVSDDGTVILGRVLDANFLPQTFVMHLPGGSW